MVRPFDPNWNPVEARDAATALLEAEGPDRTADVATHLLHANTDFQSLRDSALAKPEQTVPRTWTDWLVDGLTPLMILVMTYSVIFFLLDVRFIYTEVHDTNLRFVALFFLLGIVALNRLVARDGSTESLMYIAALGGAVCVYTFATTGLYDVGSMARHFLNDNPYIATLFNFAVVMFIWWGVNRLTHECCVDENRTAGDIGILTGTARRMHDAFQPKTGDLAAATAKREAKKAARNLKYEDLVPMVEIEAYDPTEDRAAPVVSPTHRRPGDKALEAKPVGRRHPGLSVFIVSIPVMAVFVLGLPVVQRGGEAWVRAGEFYMGVYTVSALMLLMLTSLGGLREYFRKRKVPMPGLVGFFWITVGILQIAVVLVAATQLPKPPLPPPAYIDEHQTDFWTRTSTFELSPMSAAPVDILRQTRVLEYVGQTVLVVLGLFLAFAALRGLGEAVSRIARHRHRLPRPLARFFDGLDRLLLRLGRLPAPRTRRKRIRIQPGIAQSAAFENTLSDPVRAPAMTANDQVQHAYAALCALAHDLGAPRNPDQTPFEFLEAFPKELDMLHGEAEELTRLYVVAAYSPLTMDARVLDRLRRFWMTYTRVRRRYVR